MLLTPQSDCEFDLLLASSIQSGALQSNLTPDSQHSQLHRITANSLTIGNGRVSGGLVSSSLLGSSSAGNRDNSPASNQASNQASNPASNRANNRNSNRTSNRIGSQTNNRTNSRTNRNLVASSSSNALIALSTSASSSPGTVSTGSSASPGPTGRCDEPTNSVKLACRLSDSTIDSLFSSNQNCSNNSSDQASQSTQSNAGSRRAINDSIKGNANEVNKFVECAALDSGELAGGCLAASVSNQLEPIYLLGELGSHSYELINVARSTGFADSGGRLSINAPTGGVPESANSSSASAAMNSSRTNADQLAFFKTITNEPDAQASRGRSPVCQTLCVSHT